MAANGISTLANKKLRQIAKLELAKADREARNVVEPGRYAVTEYDILELPTQYDTDNSIIDNPNTEGLLLGRPWNPGIPASDIVISFVVNNLFSSILENARNPPKLI